MSKAVAARPNATDPATTGRIVAVGAVIFALGLITAATAAAGSGAVAASVLNDPGPLVRYGLVVVRVIADFSAALTIGSLLMAATALPVSKKGEAHRPALLVAAAAATVWAATHVVLLILSFADVLGTSLTGPDIGVQLVAFVRQYELGRGMGLTAASAAVIGLLAAGALRLSSTGWLTAAALITLIPTALTGHASSSADHETAVTSLGVHLVGASIWLGGLAALVILAPTLSRPALSVAVQRYSSFALWCFVGVAVSGVINGWLRTGGLSGLGNSYGLLLLGKTVALVLLGLAGYWHRRRTMPDLEAGRGFAFTRLAVLELAVMSLAFGLAAALSKTPPPNAGQRTIDLTESLTGYPLPAAPTVGRWLTAWQPDLLWVLVATLGAGGYLFGVHRLRSRGDRWPVGRTISALAGLLILVYVTCGAPAVYGRVTFSGHMIMHMTLTMVVPPLLVLSAPITLALRTLPVRKDGSRGAREWLLQVIESRALQVLAFPPVAAALFAGSLVAFYYTGLFHLSLTTHIGHELMDVHFLVTGYLFAWVLIGVDPGPQRIGYPLRLLVLLATMSFHAFFFLALMNGNTVLQPEFFGALGRHWGRSLLADQQFGGGIGWGVGEIPTLLIAMVMVAQWSRSDDRDARRYDRNADRDGDAELAAYNTMLAELAKRPSSRS
jgi:cytochrome c oxidase assembly factor CtaG/putative copper export protein